MKERPRRRRRLPALVGSRSGKVPSMHGCVCLARLGGLLHICFAPGWHGTGGAGTSTEKPSPASKQVHASTHTHTHTYTHTHIHTHTHTHTRTRAHTHTHTHTHTQTHTHTSAGRAPEHLIHIMTPLITDTTALSSIGSPALGPHGYDTSTCLLSAAVQLMDGAYSHQSPALLQKKWSKVCPGCQVVALPP